jgi:cell wall-associated NlpC family hydrolase
MICRCLIVLAVGGICTAGCISSTIRYAPAPEKKSGGGENRAARPEAGDEGDFGALLSEPEAETPAASPEIGGGRLEKIIASYLGTPYRYGGMSRNGVDCSGLVCLVYKESAGMTLPHSSRKLQKLGAPVPRSKTQAGDLLFFRMGFSRFVDHVGICTGNGLFVHASSKVGVVESDMNDELYRTHFIEARRLFP